MYETHKIEKCEYKILEIQMRKCIRLSQMPDMIPDYQMKKQLNHKVQVIKIK